MTDGLCWYDRLWHLDMNKSCQGYVLYTPFHGPCVRSALGIVSGS
jgi:hypothetical protein